MKIHFKYRNIWNKDLFPEKMEIFRENKENREKLKENEELVIKECLGVIPSGLYICVIIGKDEKTFQNSLRENEEEMEVKYDGVLKYYTHIHS